MLALLYLSAATDLSAAGLTYRIDGASAKTRENIRAFLGPSPRTEKEAERFKITAPLRAAQALEALGYYRHKIELNLNEDQNRLTVRVEEGLPLVYTDVVVDVLGQGQTAPDFTALVSRLSPAIGDPVHHGIYEKLKAELQQLARSQGYFDAVFISNRVEVNVAESQAALNLVFDTAGRYTMGNVIHDTSVIDTELMASLAPFAEGDAYKQEFLQGLRQRLLRLGYFSSVVVVPELRERSGGAVPIRVELNLAPMHSYELGVGYSTDTRQRLSLVWDSPRLFSLSHSQQTALRWSPINPELRTTYSIPLDDSANDVLQFIARVEDNEYGDLDSRQAEIGTRREWTNASGVRAISLRGFNEEWGAFDENFSARFALAGASLSRRYRRGSAVDPNIGFRQFYSVEMGSTALGSDEDVARLYGSVTAVRRLSDNWRIVSRGELGVLWSSSERPDDLPPSLSFFAGGDNSIRGFGYQSIGREVSRELIARDEAAGSLTVGGNRLVTGSLEIQRYFTTRWRGAVFVDAGDAFLNENFDLNVGVGFGVHYLSPVGALRLEIADPVTSDDENWRIHINIGAEF